MKTWIGKSSDFLKGLKMMNSAMDEFREHFRGVIWPHKQIDGAYRYVVVGMLVTNKPLESFKGNQIILDGDAEGFLSDALCNIEQKKLAKGSKLGDASSVLTNLDSFDFEEDD